MIRFFLFWKHVIVTMWRYESGRWYVFRDTPDWVVNDIADIELEGDGEVDDFICEARKEQLLRRRKDGAAI